MRIAFVAPRFYPEIGGVETHVFEIARRMREFDVEVLATDPSGKLAKAEEIEEIKVRRFKSFAPGNAYFFSPELWSYLKRHSADYDLIHAHNFHAFPALYAALSRPKKLVFTPHYHGHGHSFFRDILFRIYRLYARRIFCQADLVICVSKFEKELILKDFKPKRVEVIPNGVNFEFMRKEKMEKRSFTLAGLKSTRV
jgi:glycosyltransferase involved in cell wall biosynthesis